MIAWRMDVGAHVFLSMDMCAKSSAEIPSGVCLITTGLGQLVLSDIHASEPG